MPHPLFLLKVAVLAIVFSITLMPGLGIIRFFSTCLGRQKAMEINVLTATAGELQDLLSASKIDSKQLVKAYLAQIKRHDGYSALPIAPDDALLRRAEMLDHERKAGKVRGPLHGIPIMIKDNIATAPATALDTTAGSLALVDSKPRSNAPIVESLLDAGAILLAKASLSELSWWKGTNLICGWNAVTGQAQSPYVRGGVLADDTYAGHSNPGGSSSGPAIAVAAGLTPVSIGTETFGSLMLPSGRAAVYSLKPSRGIAPTTEIVPISKFSDAPAPMTKSVKDLAVLMDIIVDPSKTQVPAGGYISRATGSWEGLRIGALDPAKWGFPQSARKILDESMEKQLDEQVLAAYATIKAHAEAFQDDVPLSSPSTLDLNGVSAIMKIFEKDFEEEFNSYLKLCDTPKVSSLEDLVKFNREHADKELPPNNPNQSVLEMCHNSNITETEYQQYVEHVEKFGRDLGLNKIFDEYNLNIIIGPLESEIPTFAATGGYPIAAIPVGYLDFNGRPHGIGAVARAHQDGLLIQLQSALEKTLPKRIPPPLSHK